MSEAIYVYCVLERDKAPPLGRAPKGLPGMGPVRALAAGRGLWLVVSDAPLDRYGEKAIEKGLRDLKWVSSCAVPHEAVIEHASRTGTVLPMKLFTLFLSDERALAHVAAQRKRIDRLLERLEGREEWGLRVLHDEERALERAATDARNEAPGASGTAFLLRKKKQQDAARDAIVRGQERSTAVFDELSALADDARRRPPPPGPAGQRILLDAAFLVRRGKLRVFQARAKKAAASLAKDGYDLTLTGPWPPYNFVAESA
jgi:Gas vesicle synthesis protein GvpL/GvpF